jgi:hypothetical protein
MAQPAVNFQRWTTCGVNLQLQEHTIFGDAKGNPQGANWLLVYLLLPRH